MRRPVVQGYRNKVKNQKNITVGMRENLVDWLVDVADKYKLLSETLFLTVSLIDRFLLSSSSPNSLSQKRLRLLGVSCMLVASKYENINHPLVKDFCYVTDNIYSKEEVVAMERDLLKCLKFRIVHPTAINFLRKFASFVEDEERSLTTSNSSQFEMLSCYLAELSLLDYDCVGFLPEMVAASVIFLSRFTIEPEKNPWSLALEKNTGYKPSQLKRCVHIIHDLRRRLGISLPAIHKKYSQEKFNCVGRLSSPSKIPDSYFKNIY